MELLKAIALLCQIHNADTTEWNYKVQRECQKELSVCVIQTRSSSANYSQEQALLTCLAERKLEKK